MEAGSEPRLRWPLLLFCGFLNPNPQTFDFYAPESGERVLNGVVDKASNS